MTDPIAAAALFLAANVEWMRHRPEAAEFLADVDACARIIAGIARGPADRRYLGPCGAQVYDDPSHPVACDGDVYARDGAVSGFCDTCGAKVDTAARRAWLDETVRDYAFRASEIAKAYDGINVNTIRSWAARGQLVPHGHDPEGRPLYNLGDVLDLAAQDAARRAENQAKRARRTTRDDGSINA